MKINLDKKNNLKNILIKNHFSYSSLNYKNFINKYNKIHKILEPTRDQDKKGEI